MPNWKKVIVSGSDASLNSLVVNSGVTGSLQGTASWANNVVSASYALNATSASYALTATSASFAPTAANVFIQNGNSFGAAAVLGTNDVQDLQFETSGSIRMTISGSTGSVGIGTTTPLARLHSQVTTSNTALLLQTTLGGVNAYVDLDFGTYTYSFNTSSAASIRVIDDGAFSGHITFRTKGNTMVSTQTERMRITTSGSVGIGTTSPTAALNVNGTNASSAIDWTNNTATTGRTFRWVSRNTGAFAIEDMTASGAVRFWVASDGNIGINTITSSAKLQVSGSNTDTILLINSPASASIFVVSGSGNVGIRSASPAYSLDVNGTGRFTSLIETSTRTLKTDIQPYATDIKRFKQLEPVSFTWKDTGKQDVGLIAEDVEKLFPEFVSKTDDGDVQGINYGKLATIFINVLKHQQQKIEALEKKIKKLTS